MKNDIRLALVFEKNDNDNNYTLYCPTLVKYSDDNNYTVLTGELSSSTCDVFAKIDSYPDFIFGDNKYINIYDDEYDKAFAIYIFGNDYIKKVSEDNDLDLDKSIYAIIRKAAEIDLIYYEKEMCYYSKRKEFKHRITDEEIENQLLTPGNARLSNTDKDALDDYLKYVIHKTQYELEKNRGLIKDKNEEISFDIKSKEIKNIIDSIDKRIMGQGSAIRSLVSNIYFNQRLIDSTKQMDEADRLSELDTRKQSILLDGSTGTGKTAILKEIASRMGLPLVIANANSFSETGYVGPSITDLLDKLLKESNNNIELAERGIIVLDEIDKIAVPGDNYRSMKLGVQKELLGFISGSNYTLKINKGYFGYDKIDFDTSKITFILSGAFTTLKEDKIKENDKNSLGFSDKLESDKRRVYTVTPDDYVKYGLMREFFGRVKILVTTKTYTKEDLKNILLNSEISPLLSFKKTCLMLGYSGIEYTDSFIDKVVSQAYDMSTGARSLQSVISGIQDTMLYDLLTHKINNDIIMLDDNIFNKYEKRNVRTY